MQKTEFKYRNIAGWKLPYNTDEGIFPLLVLSIRKRINSKKAVNIAVTGEAGVGKSYFAIQLAMKLDPQFDIEKQVVFSFKEFLEAVIHLKMGKPIVFDEPSYAISKHDWYKQINNALRKTIESFRYKVHPLIIPVINIDLLDKTVRSYLLQHHIVLTDRGKGTAYRLNASQFEPKDYRIAICNLKWGLYKENCNRDTCLDCRELKDCNEWSAIYERKKARIQESRYEDSLQEAYDTDSFDPTYDPKEIVELLYQKKDDFHFTTKGFIELVSIKIILEDELGVRVSDRKASEYRKRLMIRYPDIDKRGI